ERSVAQRREEGGSWAEADELVVKPRRKLAREENKGVFRQVGETDGSFLSQRVVPRQDGDDTLPSHRAVRDSVAHLRAERKRQVDGPRPERRDHACVPHLLGQQLDLGATCTGRRGRWREAFGGVRSG